MNQKLQQLVSSIQGSLHLSDDEKDSLLRKLKDVDKEIEIISFKLDRTEKVKRTTTILLEETIEELEQRRKAVEAQNHELEVESSLERVRTVSLSMKQPGDMLQVCRIISEQLQLLGIKEIRNIQTAIFYQEKGTYMNYEYYAKRGKELITETTYGDNEIHQSFADKMLKGYGECMTAHIEGDKVRDWIAYQETTNVFIDDYLYTAPSLNYYWYSLGPVALGISTYAPLSEEETGLFKRFLKVFELSYRRYLDIENAEAQTREAQIETGLERVRSRSLAMHNTSELQEVIHTVHKELLRLNIAIFGGSFIAINKDIETALRCWGSGGTADTSEEVNLPVYEKPFCLNLINGIKNGPGFFTEEYTRQQKVDFFSFLFQHEPWSALDYKQQQETLSSPGGYTRSCCVSQHTSIFIVNHFGKVFSEDDNEILRRFAKVFEQAYTRFLDLQRAEAQARESQIQLALERVRARSMAMQKSEELSDLSLELVKQVQALGVATWFCAFNIYDDDPRGSLEWGSNGHSAFPKYRTPREGVFLRYFQAGSSGEKFLINVISEYECAAHYDYLCTLPGLGEQLLSMKAAGVAFPVSQIDHVAYFKYGYLIFISYEPVPESHSIFKRFALVFEQTYTRFLDLQMAEAQTRESHIQLALERVRAKTMAMQHSDELSEVSSLVFSQAKSLGIHCFSSGFTLWDNEHQDLISWMCNADGSMNPPFRMPIKDNAWHACQYESWKKGEDFVSKDMKGEDLKSYFMYLRSFALLDEAFNKSTAAGFSLPERQVHYAANFAQGNLLFITLEPYPEARDTFIRFAKVFEQTYTRFLDLQRAEAQSREAKIEGALEKVRGRTLAMQKSDELAETAVVLFKQLISLGMSPNRLYINIIKDDSGNAEFWITDEDGSKVSFAYESNLNDNNTFQKMFEGWRQQKESLIIEMNGEELQTYFRYLASINVPFKGGLEQTRRVQHLAYFSKGFIGMASPEEQPPETVQLLQRFAHVFNLTYTRFNDLQLAEAHAFQAEQDLVEIKTARKKAEDTLKELQLTQKQLIQSEKMASLGELTAGIAHEIQNPLNFVNNFSEVSNELVDEMLEEVSKGNYDEVKLIAGDVKQNLEKINHHGKRADGIVKGMLQHSRNSGLVKEPTDINKLTDEYLRLAYHGLRAKDKSFNSELQTHYDTSIGTISIIPQDIGRVVLNLITNAFYAVAEKKKNSEDKSYEPAVTISTRMVNPPSGEKRIEIHVGDNGNGIPQKIIDKIFQPFFTTKPTGQGTGLGLSLAYDIVQAHGGEIRVETKESQGTEFIIQLPA